MKPGLFLSIVIIFLSFQSQSAKPALLQFTQEFILQQVLINKNQQFRPEIPAPKLFVESKTKLAYFQQALEPQWGFKPDAFTNAYSVSKNEVFISDDASYYKKHNRCMDDSLAHELTHYIQSKYQGFDLNDESLEWDAISVQTWFRETHCKLLSP